MTITQGLAARVSDLDELRREVEACTRCPRLVAWREQVARNAPPRFAGQTYWARALAGWGDPAARVLVVGLAPAAHGGNRTGRIFTGDRSGDFLFASLHRTGFANQATSLSRDDGLAVRDVYVTAVNRSAPPDNRPTPEERENCLPYLVRELWLLEDARVIVALGAFAWDGVLRALSLLGQRALARRPRFGHGAEAAVGRYTLMGTFHPSQQNTFTRRLTPEMLDHVFRHARSVAGITA